MVREVLKDILATDSSVQVVGEAADGKRAYDLALSLKPDLLILDLAMPVMGGLRVLELLMTRNPMPVLVLSSFVNRGSTSAIKALDLGALEVMEKPIGITEDEALGEFSETLLEKVALLSRIRVVHRLRKVQVAANGGFDPAGHRPLSATRVIAIGASTGGPPAVRKLLMGFPPSVPVCFCLVQHITPGFLGGYVDWLREQTSFDVRIASSGDPLEAGKVLVAPTGRHMEVSHGRAVLTDAPPVNKFKPSVDVLFRSVAMNEGSRSVAILLTGIGNDGAEGIRSIKSYHGFTIAENEESCVVFGMPKSAIETGCVDRVLPVDAIAPEVMSVLELV